MKIKERSLVVVIPWEDIGITDIGVIGGPADGYSKRWTVKSDNHPYGEVFPEKQLIHLLDLPKEDRNLSPEEAFKKHLRRIISRLAIQTTSKNAP